MDHVSAGEAARNGARTRRLHMREKARSRHKAPSPVSDRYQTPEWLERSFVLPLTHPEASEVPNQPSPHHDDDPHDGWGRMPEPRVSKHDTLAGPEADRDSQFVRPPSDEIDFARMIRRADLCRRAGRLSWASAGLAGLALIAFLLVASVVVLAVVLACAVASLVSLVTRVSLNRAPIARLDR